MYQSAVEEAVAEAEASGMDASAKAASIKEAIEAAVDEVIAEEAAADAETRVKVSSIKEAVEVH